MSEAIAQMVRGLSARLATLIGRCILRAIADESGGFRKLQVQILADTVRDDVEQFEPYGLSAHPHMGDAPQGIYAELGGAAGHPVVLVVHCAAARPRDLTPGEVKLYDRLGKHVHLRDDGTLHIKAPRIVLDADELVELAALRRRVDVGGYADELRVAGSAWQIETWQTGAVVTVAGTHAPIPPQTEAP
jgi:phage gp45-like